MGLGEGGPRWRKWKWRETLLWDEGLTMQWADYVLLSCTREICMFLSTSATTINSIKIIMIK